MSERMTDERWNLLRTSDNWTPEQESALLNEVARARAWEEEKDSVFKALADALSRCAAAERDGLPVWPIVEAALRLAGRL